MLEYRAGIPLQPLVLAGYFLATCVPFLASREPALRTLGVGLVLTAAVATGLNAIAFASIWCAFAAMVSVLVVRRTVDVSRRAAGAAAGPQLPQSAPHNGDAPSSANHLPRTGAERSDDLVPLGADSDLVRIGRGGDLTR